MKYKFNDKTLHKNRLVVYATVYKGKVYPWTDGVEHNLVKFTLDEPYKPDGDNNWTVYTNTARLVVCVEPEQGWPNDLGECIEQVMVSNLEHTKNIIDAETAIRFFMSMYYAHYKKLVDADKEIIDGLL